MKFTITIIFSQVLSYRIVPSRCYCVVPEHSSITKSLIGENCWVQIELVYFFKMVLWLVLLPRLFFATPEAEVTGPELEHVRASGIVWVDNGNFLNKSKSWLNGDVSEAKVP